MYIIFLPITVFFVVLALFVLLSTPIQMPSFLPKNKCGKDELIRSVKLLARDSKKVDDEGNGLPVRFVATQLRKVQKVLLKKQALAKSLTDAEKVFIDNYRNFSSQIESVRESARSFKTLPHFNGLPRVYRLVELVVKSTDGYVCKQTLFDCVSAFNDECPLCYSEIKAIPKIMDFVLCELCLIYASRLKNINERRELAELDVRNDRINVALLTSSAYLTVLRTGLSSKKRRELDELCATNGIDPTKSVDGHYDAVARYCMTLSSIAVTLNESPKWLTSDFLQSLSTVNEIYSNEMGNGYTYCSSATKDLYLSRTAEIAKKRKIAENTVAMRAVGNALNDKTDLASQLLIKEKGKVCVILYAFFPVVLSIALCILLYLALREYKILFSLLAVFPLYYSLRISTEALVSSASKKRYLPYKDINFIDKSVGANVVFTRLISNEKEARDAIFALKVAFRANPDERFSYTLLADLPASRTERNEIDEKIISVLREEYNGLNSSKFNILLRKRTFLKEKNHFQGWERKRGALLDLNSLILRDEKQKFALILGNDYKKRYVIALDADTQVLCASELLEIMEHPYNAKINVLSLSSRAYPSKRSSTLFYRIFSGAKGLDCYTTHHNENAFDLFGRANFTGKGIYRVKEFDEAVSGAFMDQRIVSHDFIEGAYAGCAQCDEVALDAFPNKYSAFLARSQRWLRGDWQLLPWLFGKVKDKSGKRVNNPLKFIDKWHVAVNLITSLVPIALVVFIILATFTNATICCFFALLPFFCELLIYFLPQLFRNLKNALVTGFTIFFRFISLPITAIMNAYSIVLTLVRLVRKKGLLEWKVFAHETGIKCIMPIHLGFSLVLFIANLFFNSSIFVYALVLLFVLALPIESLLNEKPKQKTIASEDEGMLTVIATKSWKYFCDGVTEENNFLPPDNYSETEGKGFAKRTSPTNIGMAILSACSACELKIIDKKQTIEFIENIVKTLEKLEKWKGVFYNWYDVKTLQVLAPRYVSSVDCGNLLCSLLLAKSYASVDTIRRIDALIDECCLDKLYDEEKGLLYIGYNETTKSYDGHYDLAGSEALCTYLVGIGLNKIPQATFYRLSFRHVKDKGKALYSWTGGAFEYLMPPLYFEYAHGGLFDESAKNAVKSQIKYAKNNKKKIWGASESQYPAFEDNGDYKYRAFGVPSLALSQSVTADVTAPYASILALRYAPERVCENLKKISDKTLIGKYGAYEAFDDKTVVRSFMAHHQGMCLGAICNYLCENVIVKNCANSPEFKVAEILLSMPKYEQKARKKERAKVDFLEENNACIVTRAYKRKHYGLYSFRGYHATIDELGKGFSFMDGYDLTRRSAGFLVSLIDGKNTVNLTASGKAKFTSHYVEYEYSSQFVFVKTTAYALTGTVGEVRKVTLINRTDEELTFTLSSGVEPVLDYYENDRAHREYNNMFLSCSKLDDGAVVAKREKCPYVLAFLCNHGAEYGASRASFYKRRSSPKFKNVIDPLLWAKTTITLKPKKSETVYFSLLVNRSEGQLVKALRMTKVEGFFERDELQPSGLNRRDERACIYASIISSSVGTYSNPLVKNSLNSALPTVALVVTPHSLERIKIQINSLATVYRHGFAFNLALLYRERYGYMSTLVNEVEYALIESGIRQIKRPHCSVITVNGATQNELYDLILNNSVNLDEENTPIIRDFSVMGAPLPNAVLPQGEYSFELYKGGFLPSGAYRFDASEAPPKPWSNVIARENFGTLITDSGGGFSYEGNSRENKLTEWNNDAVLDSPSEYILLCERGNVWSPTRSPVKKECSYLVEHGFGYSEFTCNYNGFIVTLTEFIGRTEVKYYKLKVKSTAKFMRFLEVSLVVNTVLGDFLDSTRSSLHGEKRENRLYMHNALTGKSIFVDCKSKLQAHSFSERSLKNERGEIDKASPCECVCGTQIVYSTKLTLSPNETNETCFCLSTGAEVDFSIVDEILSESKKYFSSLSCVKIESGNKSLDYIYKWLPYQTLCSRFFARTGFYQCSGAYGFRDQLQDASAILYIDPHLSREHILRASSRQFEKGDVQHWWHEGYGGVRTHFVDDRLFLPLAVADYIEFTGESEILAERTPFLREIPIAEHQKAVYENPAFTEKKASLLEHCRRAIFSVEVSNDGLVYMKGGDWNDAMDEAGRRGKGVTSFGTMLLYYALKRMLPYFSDAEEKKRIFTLMQKLRNGVESFFLGDRYARLVSDDGKVLGSENSSECKIDLLSQAFAVISGLCEGERAKKILATVYDRLVDEEHGIIKLLDPPLKLTKGIGYITDYPEGVRENGGQYTHAGVWYIIALFLSGEKELGSKLIDMINPINHSLNADAVKVYKTEPYVVCGDVYSGKNAGEGGWSWYTGAAGWLYRCITEHLLGIKFHGNSVEISPKLSKAYERVRVEIARKNCNFSVIIDNSVEKGEWSHIVDGVRYNGNVLTFSPKKNGKEITLVRSG